MSTVILGSAAAVANLAQLHIPLGVAKALVRYIAVDVDARELSVYVELLEGKCQLINTNCK